MTQPLMLGTRKGLFVLERRAPGNWEVTRSSFAGDPVTMVLFDRRDETVYAALDLGHFGAKLHRSDDGAESFTEVAIPEYPKSDDPSAKALKLVWCLESAGDDRPGSLWAGTVPGGLFRSNDRGESWSLNGALWDEPEREKWFGGGYDDPGIHSVCVDPRDNRRVLLGVSCGGVWITENEGESWTCSTRGMFANYMPPEQREEPAIQDPHCIVQCGDVSWAQHHNGIFRSADKGASWSEVHSKPSSFGFATVVHPTDPDTAWFVPLDKDERRIPVDGKVVVTRTRDGGKSMEVLENGLPGEHAYDVVYRHSFDIDRTGDVLAMGSTTGSLWISEDQGDSWTTVSTFLPPIYCARFA